MDSTNDIVETIKAKAYLPGELSDPFLLFSIPGCDYSREHGNHLRRLKIKREVGFRV